MVAPLGEVCWPITVAQQEAINFSAYNFSAYDFNSVQFSRSVVSDSASPGITAHQASLSITNSRSLPKLMSIESVIPSNHLILCRPLLLPWVFPNIRVFPSEKDHIGGQSIGASASALVLPINIQDWFPLGIVDININ